MVFGCGVPYAGFVAAVGVYGGAVAWFAGVRGLVRGDCFGGREMRGGFLLARFAHRKFRA